MRILIGYNGTDFARAAIDDLVNAGLPQHAEALVLTVAELCFPTVKPGDAGKLAAEGCDRVRELFPTWKVGCTTAAGAPTRELIATAEKFHPDLIVLGEPNHDGQGKNMFLGPVSQGMLTHGECALRISRVGSSRTIHPQRLLIGFDGSAGAELAVSVVASRSWPDGTKAKLLSIEDAGLISSIGQLTPQMRAAAVGAGMASKWAETLTGKAIQKLTDAGLDASVEVRSGQPKQSLIEAANEWEADCIFVAPHAGGNSFERFLLGSVSAGVASHANCSVEIVRSC